MLKNPLVNLPFFFNFVSSFSIMKKLLSVFLTLVFVFSTIGFSVNVHACSMRKGIDVTFFKIKSCCGEKGEKEGCCKNKAKIVKITDNLFQLQSINVPPSLPCFLHLSQTGSLVDFTIRHFSFFHLAIRPPLLHEGLSLPVLYRSILI